MSTVGTDAEEILERIEDAFFALDDEWQFTYLNARAADLLDADRDAVVGTVVWEAFEEAVESTFQREYEHAMDAQEPVAFEEYYPPLETWFEVNAYPSETGLSVYFRDVTDRVEREREFERYKRIVETAHEGIYVVDDDGTFQMVNESYAEMVGYSEAELLGSDVSLVVGEETAAAASSINEELRTDALSTASLEATLERADGETLETVATFSLLPNGDRIGVVRDVTERNARERELVRTRELLDQAERIAGVGGWEIDAETMDIFWSRHLFDLLGVDRGGEPSIDEALDIYHEADRPRVEAAVREAIDSGDPFDIEARYVVDGETRWLHAQGVPVTEDGDVTKVRGAAQDITERKERTRDLELYERVVETLTDGVYAVDGDNRFIMVNDAFCAMTGYDRTDLLGRPATVIKDEAVSSEAEQLVGEIARGDRREARIELELHTKSGGNLSAEARLEPLELERGVGRCGVVREITERKQFEEQLVSLHEVATDLFRSDSEAEVAEVATEAVCDVLDAPVACHFDHVPGENVLAPRATVDDSDLLGPEPLEVPADGESLVGSVFTQGEGRRLDDIRVDPGRDALDRDTELRSAVLSPIGDRGVIAAGSPETDAFDESMRQLLEIVSTTIEVALTGVDRRRILRDQHERLAAFNDLNSLVHGLAESMFGMSSQSEIEDLVCGRLAASDSYEFAWIGGAEDGEVTVRSEGGVEGYLDDTTIRLDGGPTAEGPTAQAHLTGEVQVVQNASDEERYEPWRDNAREFGYRSSASIPIVDGNEFHGTLNVYSRRPNSFSDEELEALRRLGSIIAYAMESVQRDRKLQRERNRLEFINRLLRHNLLNSLNVVKARLDLLDGRVDYEVASDLETATDRAREMIDFVETVRKVTDVIGRGEEQELKARDIGSVIEHRVARAQQSYPGATYHLESSPSVDVVADDLLGEVLDNVLINAVQHNPAADPTVWVDATVEPDEVVVSVADDGPGIPDERKSDVFDRTAKGFQDPGSGFGLFLVKEIVESYGGSIEIEDNEPEGTVFRLRFGRD